MLRRGLGELSSFSSAESRPACGGPDPVLTDGILCQSSKVHLLESALSRVGGIEGGISAAGHNDAYRHQRRLFGP